MVPVLQVYVGINGSIYAGVSSSITQTTSVTAGAQYLNKAFQPIGSYSSEFAFNQPRFGWGVSFKAYVGPKLSLLLNGVAGPYVKANAALKLDIAPQSDPWLTLKGGLEVPVGVAVEIISHVLVDYQVIAVDYWKLLLSVSGPPPSTMTPTPTPTRTNTPSPTPTRTPTPTSTPTSGPPSGDMVNVPAGTFQIGCDPAHNGGYGV